MIICIMIQRRDFCIGLFAAIAATAACRERVARLKVPESADECVDFFRFFTDPAFGLEQAKAGLNVTGEPRVLDDPKHRMLFTYENQSELVKNIDLQTTPNDGSGELRLTAIHIGYRRPIDVSLMRLESYLGPSREHTEKMAPYIGLPVSMFTDLQPDQKELSRSAHSFFPDNPIAPGHMKGDFLFQCETVFGDIKRADSLRYQRY